MGCTERHNSSVLWVRWVGLRYTDHCDCTVWLWRLKAGWHCRWHSSVGRTSPAGPSLCLEHAPRDLWKIQNIKMFVKITQGKFCNKLWFIHTSTTVNNINTVFLPMLGARSEKRFPYILLASRKAPFSRTSSSMVAVWACSVLFMPCHDSRASGRSKLSTVCTTAYHIQED